MKLHNGIKPFDDYWVGCQQNVERSILSTLYPNLKNELFLYNNAYTYEIKDHKAGSGHEFFNIEVNTKYTMNCAFVDQQKSTSHDGKKLMQQMKRWLWQKKYVFAGVDMFYLLPNTMCWEKFHWYHYTFVTGYDSKRKEVYILEHTYTGAYREYAVPEERFCKAVENGDFEHKLVTKKVDDKHALPEVDLQEIKDNAEVIISSIQDMERRPLYVMTDYDYTEQYFMELNAQSFFIALNHQMANKILFRLLKERGYLQEEEKYQRLLSECEELISGFNSIKISLFKCYKTKENREKNVEALNQYIWEILDKEVRMWKFFLEQVKDD